jgi:hypothetical protein
MSNPISRVFQLFSVLCVAIVWVKAESPRGESATPVIWVLSNAVPSASVGIGISNPFPRRVVYRVAVEDWVSGSNWSIVHSNVGIKKYVPKWAVWTQIGPFETRRLLWPTNLTCVPMVVSNVRFRAEFRETNLVSIADFTTAVVNVQRLLSSGKQTKEEFQSTK